jgi:hypothetical protein
MGAGSMMRGAGTAAWRYVAGRILAATGGALVAGATLLWLGDQIEARPDPWRHLQEGLGTLALVVSGVGPAGALAHLERTGELRAWRGLGGPMGVRVATLAPAVSLLIVLALCGAAPSSPARLGWEVPALDAAGAETRRMGQAGAAGLVALVSSMLTLVWRSGMWVAVGRGLGLGFLAWVGLEVWVLGVTAGSITARLSP